MAKRFLRFRRRKGTTLVETVISVIILSLAVMVMVEITQTKVNEQAGIDAQYSLLTVDGYLSDIYHDFHSAYNVTVTSDSVTGDCRIVFDLGAALGASIYEFDSVTRCCYKNGADQFKCLKMEATGAANTLYVGIKLPGEQLLDINIYK